MKYFKDLIALFKSKIITYTFLLIILLSAIFLRRFYKNDGLYYMLIIFVFSYFIQTLLLLKKNYAFYVFRVIMVFLISIEIYALYKDSIKINVQHSYYREPISPNREEIISHCCIYGKDTIYNVVYVRDSLGRRIPETKEEIENIYDINNKKHALFLGCSFTEGEGLDYFSTFPFMFEQLNPEYKSYNYGVRGNGPHDIALLFNNAKIINQSAIKEKDGFTLYTFIPDHLNRVYGGSFYFTWKPIKLFHNIYIENDSIVTIKLPVWHIHLVKIINNVALLKRYLKIELRYPHNEDFYRRFADIVNYIAKKYWEVNSQGNFYIAFYPYPEFELEYKDPKWINYLNPEIKILKFDLPPDLYERYDEYIIKNDGHPTKLLNEYYINKINELIEK